MNTIIHAARVQPKGPRVNYLLLKKENEEFVWFKLADDAENGKEQRTSLSAPNVAQAVQKGRKEWKDQGFRTLDCGYRYELPERDEYGNPALFFQMVKAYSNSAGTYFDDDLGHTCQVRFASTEALELMNSVQNAH